MLGLICGIVKYLDCSTVVIILLKEAMNIPIGAEIVYGAKLF